MTYKLSSGCRNAGELTISIKIEVDANSSTTNNRLVGGNINTSNVRNINDPASGMLLRLKPCNLNLADILDCTARSLNRCYCTTSNGRITRIGSRSIEYSKLRFSIHATNVRQIRTFSCFFQLGGEHRDCDGDEDGQRTLSYTPKCY